MSKLNPCFKRTTVADEILHHVILQIQSIELESK